MLLAKLSSNGQITVPKEIKEELKLEPGDRILFTKNKNGEIVIRNSNYSIPEGKSYILEETVQRLDNHSNSSILNLSKEEMSKKIREGLELDKQISFLKGLPYVGYDPVLKKPYLEYPDGRKVYEVE